MKRLLFHEPPCEPFADNLNLKLLRVELSLNYTKVDFGYQATEKNEKGGKIRISKKTYLWNKKEKFKLTHTENIPLEPKHYYLQTNDDWLFFSLYFQPMPIQCGEIFIIEEDFENEVDLNFYSIKLLSKKQYEIK